MIKHTRTSKITAVLPLLAAAAACHGVNLIGHNSSFEVGLKGFSADYSGLYSDREGFVDPFSLDDSTAAHGRKSLKITANIRGRYGLASRVYELTPGKKHTLSFYAKADIPLVVPLIKLTSTAGAHSVGLDGEVKLTTEWKRYSFSGVLTTGEKYHSYKNRYFIRVFFYQAPKATIWFDAFQLEEGELSEYQPAREAEIQVSHSRTGHIFHVGETPAPARIAVHSSAPSNDYDVVAKLVDNYTGAILATNEFHVAGGAGNTAIPLPAPALPRGSYKIHASLLRNGAELDFAEWIFAFITAHKPESSVPPERSYLGVHGGPGGDRYPRGWNLERDFWFDTVRPEWTYQLLKELGIHWQRVDCLGPVATCRDEPGEIYDRHIEEWSRLALQYDIRIMATLGAGAGRGPAWMASERKSTMTGSTLFNLAGTRMYAAKLAQAAPGIRCWETFNEPNCYFSPEELFDLNRTVYEAVKSVQPDAIIVGGSATGDLGAAGDTALSRYFELGIDKYVDVISIHGHYGPTPMFIAPIVAKARSLDKEIWDTELRVDSGSLYTGLTTMEAIAQVYGFGGELPPREHAIHSISVYMDGYANGVGKCFAHAWWHPGSIWFGNGPSWFEYDLSPRPIIPAVDAFNEIVDGGTPLGILDLGGRNRCYMVEKAGRPVAFLQLEKEQDTELELDAQHVAVFNLMGNEIQPRAKGQGRIELTLGHDPVYLVGRAGAPADELRNALLKADFQATIFKASGPRMGLSDGNRPALLCRVFNEGAISGLSGEAVLTRLPDDFTAAARAAVFSNLSLRADATIAFPVTLPKRIADCHTVEAFVRARNRREKLARKIRALTSMRATAPVAVDGKPDDWPADLPWVSIETFDEVNLAVQGSPWSGPEDCSARVCSQWDQTNLYLLVVVWDDKVMMDPEIRRKVRENTDYLYEADAVELFFDADLMRDFYMDLANEDDFQFVFSPELPDGTPAAVGIPAANTGLAREYYRWAPGDRIESASMLTPDGYAIEIRIPFTVFGNPPLPERKMIGFNFAVDDDDTEGYALQAYSSQRKFGRDLQMKWSGAGLHNPITDFGVLIFSE